MRRPQLHLDRWPLGRRLAVAMLFVAALVIAGLFYTLSWTNRREIEQFQTDHLTSYAQELARGLDGLVRDETARITNLSRSRSVREFVAVRPEQRSALFAPTLDDFTNFVASNPFYRAVLLLDHTGEVLISTEGSYVGQNFAQNAFFQQARQGQAIMSDPGISALDRRPVIWLAAPVLGQRAPQAGAAAPVAGVVAVALAPDELWQMVEQLKIGQYGYAMLVDQYGIRLAHGADRRYIFRSLAPLAPAAQAALHAQGRFEPQFTLTDTGSTSLLAYLRREPLPPIEISRPGPTSDPVYYSAARMQTRNWTVVTMQSQRELLAPADRVTLSGLAATLLLAVLLGVTVWWMAQWLVRPVPQLASAAAKIAGGDLGTPIDVRGSSELSDLAGTFEAMRLSLLHSRNELAAWASTLEQRVAARSQELAALSEIVAIASRTQSRDELLGTALHQALALIGAEMGGIWLADNDDTLRLAAKQGFDAKLNAALTAFAPGEGLLGQVQQGGAPLALDDISQALRLSRAAVREQGLHAFTAAPLRINGRNLGVIGLFSHSRQGFSPEAVALAASIAQQIALTLDNIALVEQVQHQARAVASLHERERIAGELHDSVAQTLGYLYLQLDRLVADQPMDGPAQLRPQLGRLQTIVERAVSDVRQLVGHLHDNAPPPTRLAELLRGEMEQLNNELPLRIELGLSASDAALVPPDTGAELARIVGEAVRNAARHGRASAVQIGFHCQDRVAYLSISDDGHGFDPSHTPTDGRGHFGLSVMRARAARIGGELSIASQPGQGTHIQVRWPLVSIA